MGIIAISFLLSLTFIAKKELMHGFDSWKVDSVYYSFFIIIIKVDIT
jgi:hypothetical protein